MTAIALGIIAIGVLHLDGRRVTPLNVIAMLILLAAAAVALADRLAA